MCIYTYINAYVQIYIIYTFFTFTTLFYIPPQFHNASAGSQPVARTLSSALRQSGCPRGVQPVYNEST